LIDTFGNPANIVGDVRKLAKDLGEASGDESRG
jgi:hypothetical protein